MKKRTKIFIYSESWRSHGARENEQKFFVSFFQKRRAFLNTSDWYPLGALAFLLLMFAGDGFVYIRNDRYGLVERRWSFRAARKRIGFMAADGGAGFLPDTIKGGWHIFMPFQYLCRSSTRCIGNG